ncbi:MAG: hypothetical protein ACE5K0_10035 [Candidatus Methanofastidiosia archaeon]
MRGSKKVFLGILVVSLVLPVFFVAAQQTKAVIDVSHNEKAAPSLEKLKNELEAGGYSVQMADSEITSSVLSGAQMLFVPAIWTPYTTQELNAVKTWLDEGGKAIWVATDSDYGGHDEPSTNANVLLGHIGSSLRVEPTSVEDPEVNDGKPYRVMANAPNPDTELTANVKHVVFHGPTCLFGVKEGNPVALETESLENVVWVMKTSPNGVITDASLEMPKAHENGQKGSFVMMAVEMYAGAAGSSKIVVSGEAIFTTYKNMFDTESEHGQPVQGEFLVKNTIAWMSTVEEKKAAGVSIWITLAVIAIGYLLKKK